MDDSYLSNMNSKIASINAASDLLTYVAFTVYDIELITPLFPEDCNTLSCQKTTQIVFLVDGVNKKRKILRFSPKILKQNASLIR
ncbi:hypothetical protein B4Q04_02160 [Zobellia sp. OII3]|nr:hypothetical protein B4Q04_02160 [Zobellia sp. OII3]